jgi:hypothetical protein
VLYFLYIIQCQIDTGIDNLDNCVASYDHRLGKNSITSPYTGKVRSSMTQERVRYLFVEINCYVTGNNVVAPRRCLK